MAIPELKRYDLDYTPIVDRPIVSVEAVDGGDYLLFTFQDGQVKYEADGDCCSRSWIEHITVPPDIAGSRIGEIDEPELPPSPLATALDDDEYKYDEIKVYHTVFKTPRGAIIVEYRNLSNGYYGGSLRGPV